MKQFMAGVSLAAAIIAAGAAQAQEKVKVGVVLTLSGPSAVLGQQARDGFQLALKDLGGKLGGRDAEVVIIDDELKPDVAVTKVRGLLERDKVDFVVGPIFSNVAAAIHKPVTDAEVFLISPNAGPSVFAGKGCNPYFFATSYQNDQNHEVLGQVAQNRGYKRVYLLAPNYQAGKDALAGFKRHYKGEVVEESYVPLNNLDFQSELAKIASMSPDAIFTFMPGGMGVNLVKQYRRRAHGRRSRSSPPSRSTNRRSPPSRMRHRLPSAAPTGPRTSTRRRTSVRGGLRGGLQLGPGSYSMHAYDRGAPDRRGAQGHRRQDDNKDAVRRASEGGVQVARGDFKFGANGFPSGLLPREGAKRPTASSRPRSSRRCSTTTPTPTQGMRGRRTEEGARRAASRAHLSPGGRGRPRSGGG
jgi:branched-chain amino acid transport system substrate-binding protein